MATRKAQQVHRLGETRPGGQKRFTRQSLRSGQALRMVWVIAVKEGHNWPGIGQSHSCAWLRWCSSRRPSANLQWAFTDISALPPPYSLLCRTPIWSWIRSYSVSPGFGRASSETDRFAATARVCDDTKCSRRLAMASCSGVIPDFRACSIRQASTSGVSVIVIGFTTDLPRVDLASTRIWELTMLCIGTLCHVVTANEATARRVR